MANSRMYSVTVMLPKDLFGELERMAVANYTNRASVMRKALSDYIDNVRKTETEDVIRKLEKLEKEKGNPLL